MSSTSQHQETSIDSYRRLIDAGDDVTLRKRVAAALAVEPQTTSELTKQFDKSANAIRPRVNELIRMGCVERDGKRVNDSGNAAYVNHLTPKGESYLEDGEEPEMEPTVSKMQRRIITMVRRYLRGDVDRDMILLALDRHDSIKRRMDPDWEPEVNHNE